MALQFAGERVLKLLEGPVLGIETSCDETSAAVIVGREIRSNVVSSQAKLHEQWGGIVPEAAARKHVETILPVIERALDEAAVGPVDIAGIAVTNRPGLVGALSVGVSAAKSLSYAWSVPIVGVNHLEGHVLSPMLEADVEFPHVCLLVSGGHTEIYSVIEAGTYTKLGGTIDDAAGEAFDKSARVLGLGYPGGPAIQKVAEGGDHLRYSLPRGLEGETLDFSFAGLKTAVVYLARDEGESLDVASAAASFEEAVTSVLAERTLRACIETGVSFVTLVGGVAANRRLRARFGELADARGIRFVAPSLRLCTDNAAMIALVGSMRMATGERDELELETLAVAPLAEAKTG